ncbi:MAG TPA: type II toxin-antitoxin system RelE/ParE family toxin [Geobacteraceae bacterium]|nr:type II toxin-antitoxin system RelE/ParE family toxin [Geobacteraceae bacterium]
MHIKWTSKARRDLFSVEAYISRDNPTAAVETVLKIITAVESISGFADMGRTGRVTDTRELVIPGLPFIIPYRINNSTIIILRVYHTSRKWPEQL